MPFANPYPLIFEDRTANPLNTDFDEVYERMYFHASRVPGTMKTRLYEMNHRASRDRLPPQRVLIELEFRPDESLGTITFVWPPRPPNPRVIPMSQYLRKMSFFGPSTTRKFIAGDGREYRWGHRVVAGQEWSCTSADDILVAHYDLKPPDVRTYGITSGNNLTIYQSFSYLSSEIIASFLIMRQILQYRL
ncbi:hypothetical protein D9613_011272 [Agrocybe pediades]|uniref:DUF6593 domain-containing protein n=1 Tax=Agrocybe pediades TaxID=84607 RepID=A0A8H4QSC9_9AGAR|nr:hypothetical protein D9613_011272 [Agrocybe pediades]